MLYPFLGMVKLLKSNEADAVLQKQPAVVATGATADSGAEMEYLRRTQRKMKKELDERSKEVEDLKTQLTALTKGS